MTNRTYGQFCGVARALELVGERWALLIVRDLLVGPKRFTDLRRGLSRIPSNVLATRLKELEQAGIVRRRLLERPASSVVYELTPSGSELEEVVLALGRWGAPLLAEPRPDEIATPDSMVMALRATFRPEAARGLRAGFELRRGDVVIHARVNDGRLETGVGGLPEADLVIETRAPLKPLLAGEISPAEAIASGRVRLTGDSELLARFVEIFPISSGVSEPSG